MSNSSVGPPSRGLSGPDKTQSALIRRPHLQCFVRANPPSQNERKKKSRKKRNVKLLQLSAHSEISHGFGGLQEVTEAPFEQRKLLYRDARSGIRRPAPMTLTTPAKDNKPTDGALQQDIFSAISGSFASRKTAEHEVGRNTHDVVVVSHNLSPCAMNACSSEALSMH